MSAECAVGSSVDDVVAALLGQVRPTDLTETRSLEMAQGCYLARDLIAPMNVPPVANSAMDGYAIDSKNTAVDTWLTISDRIPAGHRGVLLKPGTVARIFTGAELPQGADAVVIQENAASDTRVGTATQRVRFTRLPAPGENVRQRGQDLARGDVILQAGERLSSAHLALLASVGMPDVLVFTPLRVALIATGDELVQPGEQAGSGQIYNSTRVLLSGILKTMGMVLLDLGIVRDRPIEIEARLLSAAAEANCILTTGGVSVGEEDHVKAAVANLGSIDIWKLAIKPGKPLAYGSVRSASGGHKNAISHDAGNASNYDGKNIPFFGLPGNPVSTFVTFMMLVRPYLIAMQGGREPHNKAYFGVSNFHRKAGNRREYVRVRRTTTSDGTTHLDIFPNQSSAVMTSVAWADALAEIDINQQVKPGDVLKFYAF